MPNPDEFNAEEWLKQPKGVGDAKPPKGNGANNNAWGEPFMGVMRLRRRPPPPLPLEAFGESWGDWIVNAAKAAACPVDYVAAPLLASVSTLVGHARWPAIAGWCEPPHLWCASVGDSGDGKSPGANALMRNVLPTLERRMIGDFPDRLREWQAASEFDKVALKRWKEELREAQEKRKPLPAMPKPTVSDVAPERPRLIQHDTTIEQIGTILHSAAPKGLLMVRDEIAGWFEGMNAYNPASRAFWIEGWDGGPYKIERRSHSHAPIEIPRLAVALFGGTQPERLATLAAGPDDGLFSRILWAWPNALNFELGKAAPGVEWAIEALDKLRELDLAPGDPPNPIFMQLTPDAEQWVVAFAREMDALKHSSGGLLRSAYGKARGFALRLSLVLEWLWFCARPDMPMPPDVISMEAYAAATMMIGDFFMPMAERVFGDASANDDERGAATLSRWIFKEHPEEVHVRHLLREVRLPGLRNAEQIKGAAKLLVDADWLKAPNIGFGPQSKVAYAINPRLWEDGNG
jgi:hypothetical protein